jgi:hypothetical protein
MTGSLEGLEAFEVGPCRGIEFVLASDPDPVAVFLLERRRDGSVAVHFCFVPAAWGYTLPVAAAFLEWVWKNTAHTRLLGPVPAHNRLARRLAIACGFEPGADLPGQDQVLEIRKP